jgi:hypothetical protein
MSTTGESGTSVYRVYRITATALSLIILIGLTIYIFYDSFQVATLYSWHPTFFTLGVSKCKINCSKFVKLVYHGINLIYVMQKK